MDLKKNDELIVDIQRMGDDGEGIAVVDGKVIFVLGALPGECVKVHIISEKKSFLIAKIVEIFKESKIRTQPHCINFLKCGGCDLQHMQYNAQLEFKKEKVKNALLKFGKIDTEINDVVASEKGYRYRNKFAFPVTQIKGDVIIGMYRKNSHSIIKIDDCLLQSERSKIIVNDVYNWIIGNNISCYNEENKTGIVKHIVVRESGDSFILTVVVTDKKFDNFDELIVKLKTHFSDFGIVKNVNNLNNNVIFGKLDQHIYGIKELEKVEFGIKYNINNRSFLQVNDYIKNLIYKKILDCVSGEKNIIDAYSGAGLLSSIVSLKVQNVIGIEIVKEATKNANYLKTLNNLNNLTNINGDCAMLLPEISKKFVGDFSIILDPPRKGLDKRVVDSIIKSMPNKIIYLSCDPITLARDLGLINDLYKVVFVQPYDMFPETANVETLVLLEKRSEAYE